MNLSHFIYLFLKLNLWLCLTSVLMVIASALALSPPVQSVGLGLLVPSFLFAFIYIEDRRSISEEDWANQPRRTRMVQRYQDELFLTEILALGAYEILLLYFVFVQRTAGVEFILLGQLPLLVLAVYEHLKRYPTFDSITVGATWAFVTLFAVMVATEQPFSVDVAVVFLAWFVIVFAGVESRNLADVEGDSKTGKTTLAGYLGEIPTKAMEGIFKTLGVAIFCSLSNSFVALVVVVYLLLLRVFRFATRRANWILFR